MTSSPLTEKKNSISFFIERTLVFLVALLVTLGIISLDAFPESPNIARAAFIAVVYTLDCIIVLGLIRLAIHILKGK